MSNNTPREMSHLPADGVKAVSIAVLPVLMVLMMCVVFFSMTFIRASTPVAAKWSLWVGISTAWFIYFYFLFGILWVKVDGDEEVILQDTLNQTDSGGDQTDDLNIPKGMRSVGGPGYRAKSMFEEVKVRLQVKKKELGGSVECNDVGINTYNLSYSFTYSRIRGRYSVIGAFYNEDEAVRTLQAIVGSTIEERFAEEPDGKATRKDLDGFNSKLSEVLGGDRVIDDKEIRCGFYITGIIIKKIDEEAATKARNLANTLTTAVKTTLSSLVENDGLKGVNPNLALATAASLVGLDIKKVEIKIIDGLPPGATGHINV